MGLLLVNSLNPSVWEICGFQMVKSIFYLHLFLEAFENSETFL